MPEDEKINLIPLSEKNDEAEDTGSSMSLKKIYNREWFSIAERRASFGLLLDEKDETTSTQTFFNICNANLGTGMLAMPFVLRLGGYWGIFLIFFISFLGNYTGKILVDCMYEERGDGKRERVRNGYVDIGEAFSPKYGKYMVHIANCFDQFSHCALLLIMCGTVMGHTFPDSPLSESAWTAIAGILVLPTVFVRKMVQLACVSMITVIVAVLISTCVIGYSLSHATLWRADSIPAFNIHTVPIAVGIVMVTYSSQAYLPSIEKSMENREEFNAIMDFTYTFVAVLKFGCGILVFLSFKDHTDQIMTLNLPHGGFRITVCIAVVVLALFFYIVPMFTIFDIVENQLQIPWMTFNYDEDKKIVISGLLLRTVLVSFTILLGVMVPHFSLLMSFIGSLTGMILVLIYPCLFHMKIQYDKLKWHQLFLDGFIILFAIVGGILGIIYSSLALYTVYNQDES